MKNYDNNNTPNRYGYRDREEEKKKKSHNLLWLLLLLLFFFVALTTVIVVGITQSWFAFTQKMEGDFEFENGIVMSYEDIGVEGGKTFYLLKQEGNNFSSLNETQVRFDDIYTVANPKLSAAKGSSNFFLRAKLEYSFIKNINGEDVTLNLETLANALNTQYGVTTYTKDNVLSAIYAQTLEFNNSWLAASDGWYYYSNGLTEWSTADNTANYNDLKNAIVSPDTEQIKVFKEADNKVTIEVIPGETNHMETFHIKHCKITLTINACETTEEALNAWLELA